MDAMEYKGFHGVVRYSAKNGGLHCRGPGSRLEAGRWTRPSAGRRICRNTVWIVSGSESDSVWETCGDQLCTVMHGEAFGCTGRSKQLIDKRSLSIP